MGWVWRSWCHLPISMSKCCLGLVSHPSCLHTGWKEAVPRNDSSYPQEESPFGNAYFFPSDEYRGSLIKQVTYMQLKSSEEIFLYVYPKYQTHPRVWNSSSWRLTSPVGVVWKTALWHGTKPWDWSVRQVDFQGRRFYTFICHCPCLLSVVHPKYSWFTVHTKIVRATWGAPWFDIPELQRISQAQLGSGDRNIRLIACIQHVYAKSRLRLAEAELFKY